MPVKKLPGKPGVPLEPPKKGPRLPGNPPGVKPPGLKPPPDVPWKPKKK
jgi:hypothetical protein